MVRLVYTCPKTGVAIIGGKMSESHMMMVYDQPAVVKCFACRETHNTLVHECRMYRVAETPFLPGPLKAS